MLIIINVTHHVKIDSHLRRRINAKLQSNIIMYTVILAVFDVISTGWKKKKIAATVLKIEIRAVHKTVNPATTKYVENCRKENELKQY